MNAASKAAVAGIAVLSLALFYAAVSIPAFGSPIMEAGAFMLKDCGRGTGAANVVCAVTLDYRGFDTLGEASILLAAVSGVVVVLAAKEAKKGPSGEVGGE